MRVLASMRDDLRLLFAPVGAAQDAATDFESYRRARTLRAARAALMLGLFGLLFFLPTDFWIFAATPRLCREIIWFRLSAVLLGLPVYAALLRASVERSTPVVVGCGLLCATYSFGFLGLVSGPAEVPLVFTAFFVPTMSVMFLLPLRQRILMVSGTSLGAMLAYYGPHPAYLSYRYNGMVWVFLIFGSATSVAFGHMLYLLEHGKFLQRLQIQQHAAKLEELDRLKDSFVSTVSHELRTPLNTIIGLTDLMLHDPPADQRAYVKTVHQSGETLLAIINDILDLAKIKSGKVELEHLPYAPGEVVDAVVGLFAVACGKKRLRLASSVPAGLPTLLGDARRLKQILTNLVGNAVKFTGRGEVNVDVSLSRESQPMLTIAVSDTGAGVSADRREAVFEEFTQESSSTARHYGGTGLGLPIVRRLARLMGGEVTLSENLPTGCLFTVRLPVQVAAAPPTPTHAAGFAAPLTKPLGKGELLAEIEEPAERRPVEPEALALRETYLRRRREELVKMQGYLAAADFEQLTRVGHNLKGSGASFGFEEMSLLGQQIEAAAPRREAAVLADLLSRLGRAIDREA